MSERSSWVVCWLLFIAVGVATLYWGAHAHDWVYVVVGLMTVLFGLPSVLLQFLVRPWDTAEELNLPATVALLVRTAVAFLACLMLLVSAIWKSGWTFAVVIFAATCIWWLMRPEGRISHRGTRSRREKVETRVVGTIVVVMGMAFAAWGIWDGRELLKDALAWLVGLLR